MTALMASAEKHTANGELGGENGNTTGDEGKSTKEIICTVLLKIKDVILAILIWLKLKNAENDTEPPPPVDQFLVNMRESNKSNSDTNKDSNVSALEGQGSAGMKPAALSLIMERIYIDDTSTSYYYWSALVAIACLYNLMMVIARITFTELDENLLLWIVLDYLFDFIYFTDTFVESRKLFLADGLEVTDGREMFLNYLRGGHFWFDIISIVPTDVFYIFWPFNPIFRLNRLARCHRIGDFTERAESRTTFPNLLRVIKLVVLIFVVFHWNACAFFTMSKISGTEEIDGPIAPWQFQYNRIDDPVVPTCDVFADESCLPPADATTEQLLVHWQNRTRVVKFSNLTKQYLFSVYWSALILTTIGEQVPPRSLFQMTFVTVDILFGLLVFATIVGNVGEMVTSMNADKSAFEEQQDGVKQYMLNRKVHPKLQKRIIQWFRYMYQQGQSLDEEEITATLPTRLKGELAMKMHLDTLRKVKIFQELEQGLLEELVLKLKLQVFCPGDYICRKGDVGKEMYIVKRGSLNVVAEDGIKVFVTLKAGTVFGELSILDIPGAKNGNKRTANVRSVGYSDLFVLSKDDLWDALREYPEGKALLLKKGHDILAKDNLIDEEKAAEAVDVGPMKTTEQKLDAVERKLKMLGTHLDSAYKNFVIDTADRKKRVADLERSFQQNRAGIKRHIMMGTLRLDDLDLEDNEKLIIVTNDETQCDKKND